MSSSYVVTGKINTEVALTYTNSDCYDGKWRSQPGGIWPKGETQFFEAENRDSSEVPPAGWIKCYAADGTEFTFSFDDKTSEDNICKSEMNIQNAPFYLPVPDYPKSGKTWTVTFYVKLKIADAPVFPEDLIKATKCALFPESKVKELIGDRKCVYLRDVMESTKLNPIDKVWCATHPLFLTASSKADLTRNLVNHSIHELTAERNHPFQLIDEALQANLNFEKGLIGPDRLFDLRKLLDEKTTAIKGFSQRDTEIYDIAASLTTLNANDGWANAVSSYINNANGNELKQRLDKVLDIVKGKIG